MSREKKRLECNVIISENEAFIDFLPEDDVKKLSIFLREMGLEFEAKILYCG